MKKLFAILLSTLMLAACMLQPTIIAADTFRTMDEFDSALNVSGGQIDFENDAENPWILCADSSGVANSAVKSNTAGMDSSSTEITFSSEMPVGGRLQFSIRLETEDGYDRFALYDNDEVVLYRSGIRDWSVVTYTVETAGMHTFRLVYAKDDGAEEGEDCVFLDDIAILPANPNAQTINQLMNASGNSLSFTVEDGGWIVSEYGGVPCVKSNIESCDESAAIMYTDTFIEAETTINFDYATASEEDFDILYFYAQNMDTDEIYEELLNASGDNGWNVFAWAVPESGNYRLFWKYEKDGSGSDYADAVYVKNCNIPSALVGDVQWSTSFEDANPLNCGWTEIDADGDGYTWQWTRDYENFLYGHSVSADGDANMSSASYLEYNLGTPLNPDNYLVSPAITIGADNTAAAFKFFVRGQDATAYTEHFQILVGETPTEFTDVIFDSVTSHDWISYSGSLNDYIGQTIYVAIRHFDTSDMYYLNLDLCQIIADGTIEVAETEPVYQNNTALNEALNVNGGNLEFYTGSMFPWTTTVQGDRKVAVSTNHIGLSAGYVQLFTSIEEPCRLSFDWKNSCEAQFDALILMINHEEVARFGDVNSYFETVTYDIVEPGEYEIVWMYEKDDEISEYSDVSYLDNVCFLEAIHPQSIEVDDFISISCGSRKAVSYTVLPDNTTDKRIVWTSSDESVVAVDAAGIMTGVGMGHAIVTATTVDGGICVQTEITVTSANEPQTFYGYRQMQSSGGRFDFISFNEANLGEVTSIASIEYPSFSAMEYYNGTIYGYSANTIFGMTLDSQTPEALFTIQLPDSSVAVSGMAYNYADETMYMLLTASNSAAIYTLDLNSGEFAMSSVVSGMLTPGLAFAISTDGIGYAIDRYFGNLYSIDLDTGVAALIGATGYEPNNNQSMTYDHNNGRLVWAMYRYSNTSDEMSSLVEIDPNTGVVTDLGSINSGNITQLVGLFCIPENEVGNYRVEFIDSMTGEVIETYTAAKGSIITDFPVAPIHDGLSFSCWTYDGAPIMANTRIFARYEATSVVLGDADGDGVVTSADALIIMRYAMEVDTIDEANLPNCDLNGDGYINVTDALIALRVSIL